MAKDMLVGVIFTKENLRAVRPGFGLPPKYFDLFLGKKSRMDLKKGMPVKWEMLLDQVS
jgi:N-acetylneuraminate synthase